MPTKPYDIVAIGRGFTDVIARVSEEFLAAHNLRKGRGVELPFANITMLQASLNTYELVPGGPVSNTIAGLAGLGAKTAFIGKVCDDAGGRAFRNAYDQNGVEFPNPDVVASAEAISPICLVMITPDGERTMAYSKGVADTLSPDDLYPSLFTDSKLLLIQGHLLFSETVKDAIYSAIETARNAGVEIAITISDLWLFPHQRAALWHIHRLIFF